METPFLDRNPSNNEIEQLRLILSTYQDGTGMIIRKNGTTIPGWRDFERAIAATFNGIALENKAVYDVLIPTGYDNQFIGISCKMRNMLRQVDKDGRVTIELSNASGEFWDKLKPLGINQINYSDNSYLVGKTLIERVWNWHSRIDIENGGTIITTKSYFLSLQYNEYSGHYQLFQFPIHLPNPDSIEWFVNGRHLIGILNGNIILEWYGFSGGQLKYYPNEADSIWKSHRFVLEPLPSSIEHGLINKAKSYYKELWEATLK